MRTTTGCEPSARAAGQARRLSRLNDLFREFFPGQRPSRPVGTGTKGEAAALSLEASDLARRKAEAEHRAGTLPGRSGQVLEAVLFRGSLPRGDVPALLGAAVSLAAIPRNGVGAQDETEPS